MSIEFDVAKVRGCIRVVIGNDQDFHVVFFTMQN